jgi:hypothetical protein
MSTEGKRSANTETHTRRGRSWDLTWTHKLTKCLWKARDQLTQRHTQKEEIDANVIKTVKIIDYVQEAQLTGLQSNMESVPFMLAFL